MKIAEDFEDPSELDELFSTQDDNRILEILSKHSNSRHAKLKGRKSSKPIANVPPHLVGPASEQATKAALDYAQSKSVSDRLRAMMDAARSGNVESYQLLPLEGALQITTSQGVHRINMTEINQYANVGQPSQQRGRRIVLGRSTPILHKHQSPVCE